MNNKLHSIFTFLFISLLLSACSVQKKAVETNNEYQPYPNALLWELSGKDIEKPSYVFGTVHLIDKDQFFLPNHLLTSLDQSEEIVFEVDLAEMTNIGSQMNLLTKTYMNDGQTLKDLVTDKEYDEIQAFFKKMGLPLFFFERMKPMFLSVLASMEGDMTTLQTEMTSYEFELVELANKRNMESSGLETLDFQIGLFDSIPYDVQADMLLKSIRMKEDDSSSFDEMMQMYVDQNINGMLTTISDEDIGEFEHLLLTKRNEAWIPQIIEKSKRRSTFFAVGAGHLAGENGVLWLLEKEGYQLKPLSIDNGTD